MDRFDPCGTDECKKRCDSYGVACDDIMADEIDRLRAELAETQTVKDSFTVPYDYALLLDENAAMREEIGELRAEVAEARKPDCRTCVHFSEDYEQGHECLLAGGPFPCTNGEFYKRADPVRLYEIDAAMAGGAK